MFSHEIAWSSDYNKSIRTSKFFRSYQQFTLLTSWCSTDDSSKFTNSKSQDNYVVLFNLCGWKKTCEIEYPLKKGAVKIENMMLKALLQKEKWHCDVCKGSFFKWVSFPYFNHSLLIMIFINSVLFEYEQKLVRIRYNLIKTTGFQWCVWIPKFPCKS